MQSTCLLNECIRRFYSWQFGLKFFVRYIVHCCRFKNNVSIYHTSTRLPKVRKTTSLLVIYVCKFSFMLFSKFINYCSSYFLLFNNFPMTTIVGANAIDHSCLLKFFEMIFYAIFGYVSHQCCELLTACWWIGDKTIYYLLLNFCKFVGSYLGSYLGSTLFCLGSSWLLQLLFWCPLSFQCCLKDKCIDVERRNCRTSCL